MTMKSIMSAALLSATMVKGSVGTGEPNLNEYTGELFIDLPIPNPEKSSWNRRYADVLCHPFDIFETCEYRFTKERRRVSQETKYVPSSWNGAMSTLALARCKSTGFYSLPSDDNARKWNHYNLQIFSYEKMKILYVAGFSHYTWDEIPVSKPEDEREAAYLASNRKRFLENIVSGDIMFRECDIGDKPSRQVYFWEIKWDNNAGKHVSAGPAKNHYEFCEWVLSRIEDNIKLNQNEAKQIIHEILTKMGGEKHLAKKIMGFLVPSISKLDADPRCRAQDSFFSQHFSERIKELLDQVEVGPDETEKSDLSLN